jgi:hypothetical protein
VELADAFNGKYKILFLVEIQFSHSLVHSIVVFRSISLCLLLAISELVDWDLDEYGTDNQNNSRDGGKGVSQSLRGKRGNTE